MTKQKQKLVSKKARKSKVAIDLSKIKLQRSDWIIVPLGFLALFCIYRLIIAFPYLLLSIFSPFDISAMALVVGSFTVLYIYKTLKKESISKGADIIARIFSFIIVCITLYLLSGIGQTCSGLFGTRTSCIEANLFTIHIFLLNPFTMLIWEILALVGFILLVSKYKK